MALQKWDGTEWQDVNASAPPGGDRKQILTKTGPADYDAGWTPVPGAHYGPTPPAAPAIGQRWIKTDPPNNPQLNVYDGTAWDEVQV